MRRPAVLILLVISSQAWSFERRDVEGSVGSISAVQETTGRGAEETGTTKIHAGETAIRFGYLDVKATEKLQIDTSVRQYLTPAHRDIFSSANIASMYSSEKETTNSSVAIEGSARRWREGPSALDTIPAALDGDFVFQNELQVRGAMAQSVSRLWGVGASAYSDHRRGYASGRDSGLAVFLEYRVTPIVALRAQGYAAVHRDERYDSVENQEKVILDVKLTPLDRWDLQMGRGALQGESISGRSQLIVESSLTHRERLWTMTGHFSRGLNQSSDKRAYVWGQIYEGKAQVDISKATSLGGSYTLSHDDDIAEQEQTKTTRRALELGSTWTFGDPIEHEERLRIHSLRLNVTTVSIDSASTISNLKSLRLAYSRIF